MTYLIQNEIASNPSMMNRIAQAAAAEVETDDPDRWTYENRRDWASAPGWDAAWESALVAHPVPPLPLPDDYVAYDPGRDEAVITDGMILSQVQAMTA